jgi:hypothetical protein
MELVVSTEQDRWTEREKRFDEHPVRATIRGLSMGWVVVLAVIALALITSALLWTLGVFASDIKGQGDAQRIKNSAPNRIQAQELFETRYQDILAADRNINVTNAALTATPDDAKLKAELIGQKQYCNGLVGKYNADSRKFTRQDFRAADLPYQIDTVDRTTDCREDSR